MAKKQKIVKAKVVKSHRSSFPNPIELKKGELVSTKQEDKQFPGWIWTITQSGNAGWAPKKLLRQVEEGAIVVENYNAKELNTQSNEVVNVHEELNGWCLVENQSGEVGWIPEKSLDIPPKKSANETSH